VNDTFSICNSIADISGFVKGFSKADGTAAFTFFREHWIRENSGALLQFRGGCGIIDMMD
jgi:hypothetical protein